jgi:hypothetical protein
MLLLLKLRLNNVQSSLSETDSDVHVPYHPKYPGHLGHFVKMKRISSEDIVKINCTEIFWLIDTNFLRAMTLIHLLHLQAYNFLQ